MHIFCLFSNHGDMGLNSKFIFTSIMLFGLHVLSSHRTDLLISEPETKVALRKIGIQCSDVEVKKAVEYRGQYIVLRNYIMAKKQFKCLESVTLSVPGDYRFLDNILPLVERWQGPISVGLYAPGYDFFTTLQTIAYLRSCTKFSNLVKEFVTFHIFFDTDHMPIQHDEPLLNIYEDTFDCIQKPPYETLNDSEMYKQKTNLFYPINIARNIAKLNAQTHFIFPSDIELYPTRNFIPKFLNFTSHHPQYFQKNSSNVFVLPLFEVKENYQIPETKTQLQYMLKNGTAFGFHQKVCRQCHALPKNEDWIKGKETDALNIFTSAKRQGLQKIWEPFFVCTQKEPLWDERLNWEGQGNKMCQAYYLCLLDYNFLVLDNAFLIHKPGVKKKKVQNIMYKNETIKNNNILRHITTELTKIYGSNSHCLIHSI